MIVHSQRRFWKRRFALLPITLHDGPNRTFIWLEWVWVRNGGDCTEISLTDPEAQPDELEAVIDGLKAKLVEEV